MSLRLPVSHPARLLTAGLMIASLALAAFCLAQEGRPQPPKKTETSAKRFKNIKVLKDLPADQLIPVMHKFNTSLGVKCDYCHVVGENHTGFEKDDKPEKRKGPSDDRDVNGHQQKVQDSGKESDVLYLPSRAARAADRPCRKLTRALPGVP